MLRPWTDAAYWLAPHNLLILLSFRARTTCPGVTLPTYELIPRTTIIHSFILFIYCFFFHQAGFLWVALAILELAL